MTQAAPDVFSFWSRPWPRSHGRSLHQEVADRSKARLQGVLAGAAGG